MRERVVVEKKKEMDWRLAFVVRALGMLVRFSTSRTISLTRIGRQDLDARRSESYRAES